MPCGRFGANAAWLRLTVLTYNVLTALKRLALPPDLLMAQPKRLRFLIFNTSGKLVHHARRTLLRLGWRWQRFSNWHGAQRLLPLPAGRTATTRTNISERAPNRAREPSPPALFCTLAPVAIRPIDITWANLNLFWGPFRHLWPLSSSPSGPCGRIRAGPASIAWVITVVKSPFQCAGVNRQISVDFWKSSFSTATPLFMNYPWPCATHVVRCLKGSVQAGGEGTDGAGIETVGDYLLQAVQDPDSGHRASN